MNDIISDQQLDAWLATDRVDAPNDALVQRILATAPTAPRSPRHAPWWRLAARARWLWPGAGLAGIGLAGTWAGAFAVSVAMGASMPPASDAAERATAFSAIPADWSEE